jgi:ribosomal protein S18 acetylase RimI-like enzyme
MSSTISINDITIRTELRPGDLGHMIYRQAKLYSEENGYGISFESYLAVGVHEFYKSYNQALDRVWICEHNSSMIGFLMLIHRENNAAQLRYFYLEPEYRGIGLGKKMMDLYMDFLLKTGYSSCYLWTTHEQDAAASLYKKYGFQLTQEKESTAFGKLLTEQRYDLVIKNN